MFKRYETNVFKRSLIAFSLLLGLSSLATAQQWPNVPIVDGAAYSCGSVNAVSNCTVPAGPAKSGLETVPADTNATGGQSPQTVKMSLASLNALPYVYRLIVTGTAADTVTMGNTTGTLVLDATGTITQETVTLPAAPIDGQIARIASNKTITTFAVVANSGQTLASTTPTVLTASTTAPQGYSWLYRATDLKWYRLQ